MEALKQNNLDPLFIAWKNRTVNFMKAYQEQDVHNMLSHCTQDCTVAFLPLGEQGQGNVHKVGKAIWSSIIAAFPTIDNTVNTVVKENGDVRCEASVRGKQAKDFAGLPSKGNTFEEDHVFIFKMDELGMIRGISVNWNHENLVRQLTLP
ncbi:MAG: nuclear transport factor 2 family protein [Bacteroidota bacterium]